MSTKVKFVVDGSVEQDLMLKAAQSVQSARLPTEKITSNDVLQLKNKDKHLYVCGQFSGEAFEHLANIKCRIVGPQCVVSCLELQIAVPNVPHPINNIAMQDVVVSCSSIEKAQRAHIHQLLEWMGGRVSKDLTEMVTHLVVGEVGSKKYHVAANLKKQIMLPDWIEVAWEESQTRHFSAISEAFLSEYRCPAFKGCIICVTGVESTQRQDVRQRVPQSGGYYTGELKYNECTHLIVGAARGPKFEFARKWKIHTVSINWFYDSIEAGYCLDEQLYNVLSQDRPTSTPVKANQNQRLSTLGDISAINVSSINPVNETAVSESNITMETSRLAPPPRPLSGLEELEKLDLAACEAEMFLDGCKIFLSGFSGQHLEKLRKVVNAGGGTRFNQINENVSHVIIGNKMEEHVQELKGLPNRPLLVSVHWLLECAKQGRQVSEGDFQLKDILDVEEPGKENEITFKLPGNQQPKRVSKVGARKKSDEHTAEEEDILSQYLPNATSTGAGGNDSTMIQEENPDRTLGDETKSRGDDDDDDETQIDENEGEDEGDGERSGIFAGKKFVVTGFPPEQYHEVCEMIPSQGGVVLPLNTRSIPDYAVVPIIGSPVKITVGEIVTNCWLQMSLEGEALLEPSSNDLFTPIPIMKEAMPLRDCVISISQYCYVERDCLLHIAELLGARCQEYFVRKAVNNLEANTHLLLRDPEGTKYVAAKKWKVPAVTRHWLLDCARTGKKRPEKNYLVDLPQKASTDLSTSTKEDPSARKESPKAEEAPPVQTKPPSLQKQPEKPPEDYPQPQKTPKSVTINEKSLVQEMSKASTPAGRPIRNKSLEMVKQQPITNKTVEQVKGQTPGRDSTTPSRILRPGFKPSFDLDDAMGALDSPGMPAGKGYRRKSSLPLEEFFHQNIANALQMGSNTKGGAEDEDDDIVFKEEEPAPGILHGVVICVSKKLSRKQGDYNDIAVALGAEYHWTYDEHCTHFIFQGKANDTAKEFRLAKSQGKIIVSSHWLLACQEENKRLDETCYPHTFNPKLSLSVVASQSRTPGRSKRSKVAPPASATPLAPKPPPPTTPLAPKPPPPMEKKEVELEADTMSDDELLRAVEIEEQIKTPGDHGTSIKQDLQKQLEDIMPSSLNLRGSRRRGRRPGSSASISMAGDSADDSTGGRRSTRSRAKRGPEKKEGDAGKDLGQHVEASQSVQITWDDPTSRKEKEKVMAQIKRTDNGHAEPEQHGEDAQQVEEQVMQDQGATKTDFARPSTSSHKPEDSPPTPTPKAPPIRLPAAKPAVAPQPMDETQDDPQQEVVTKQTALPPKFLFTGMGAHEKIDYSALIEELGGEVKDAQYFDASCSHIIVGIPTRNEKYLAALATGKWVLHKSYLEACRVERAFVEEEPHEWGNRTDLSKLNETGKKMAVAATRWRMKIQDQEKMGSIIGAFDGWKVLLLVEKSKEMCFKRLLEAGGAKVLAVRPPFTSHLDASHAFFDLHKVKVTAEAVAVEELVQSGIMCLKPEYIADYLVQDPCPDPENYIINEAKPILQKLVDQAGSATKRRGSELATTPRNKRTRHR